MSRADVTHATTESRTGIHVFGAFVIAAIMGAMLAWIPLRHSRESGGVIRQIQRGAIGDLQLLLRHQNEFKARTGTYTTDLNALGIAPKMVLYKFGFTSPSSVSPNVAEPGFVHRPELMDLDALKAAIPALDMKYSPVTKLETIDFAAAAARLCPDCTASESAFKAVALANLDADDDLDVWVIDQGGETRHVSDDLAGGK